MTIALLEKETIDRIAAGEVVERPASVVKELVENAVDAGATAVTIEIREGGKKRIRVTDNGEGIPAEEVETAFLRHATSKIRTVDDLQTIASLGFRGEALSSIAAVSRLTCVTKHASSLSGIRLLIEGGRITEKEEIGAPQGTTMIVDDLFFHTPARLKFLRSAGTESRHVRVCVEELALAHPDVAFTFLADGRTQLSTAGNGVITDLVYAIYGREIATQTCPLFVKSEGVSIHGLLGRPQIARGNRAWELFFVNGRPVRNDLLSHALEEGYRGFLMQHRYPFAILSVDMDGSLVDVNVHPAKREVRFRDPESFLPELTEGVRQALSGGDVIPMVTVSSASETKEEEPVSSGPPKKTPEPFEAKRMEQMRLLRDEAPVRDTAPGRSEIKSEADETAFDKSKTDKTETDKTEADRIGTDKTGSDRTGPASFLSVEAKRSHRLIGQLFETYWLFEYDGKFYMLDQHAAHEKVLYERLIASYRERKVASQMILPATVIEPGPGEAERLRAQLGVLNDLGFEIEPFGGNSFKISAVPANLYRADPKELLVDILDTEIKNTSVPTEVLAERLASMACKAAVKGNHRMSPSEAESLFDELLTLENPYHCPHGRPTMITMTKADVERSFKRIL